MSLIVNYNPLNAAPVVTNMRAADSGVPMAPAGDDAASTPSSALLAQPNIGTTHLRARLTHRPACFVDEGVVYDGDDGGKGGGVGDGTSMSTLFLSAWRLIWRQVCGVLLSGSAYA